MKTWIIEAIAPLAGCRDYYVAYSEENPTTIDTFIDNIIPALCEDLWDNYSWGLHLDDDEYESEEEYDNIYDEAYQNWIEDCDIIASECTEEELIEYAPGGNLDALEIVYDERNSN